MEKLGGSNGFSAKLIGRNIGFRGTRFADLRQRGCGRQTEPLFCRRVSGSVSDLRLLSEECWLALPGNLWKTQKGCKGGLKVAQQRSDKMRMLRCCRHVLVVLSMCEVQPGEWMAVDWIIIVQSTSLASCRSTNRRETSSMTHRKEDRSSHVD